jgi:hypothetical protein
MFDLFFYYKNYNRYVHILKYSKNRFHFLNILKMQKITLFFDIKQLTDINNQSILSCIFFFKYYFGIIPFFKNYKHEFKLNIHYFSFVIEYSFYNKAMYYVLYYFINDIYFMINKMYLLNSKFKNYWEFIVNDMNFFIEKKNSLGFFNLKHKLIIQTYVYNTQN